MALRTAPSSAPGDIRAAAGRRVPIRPDHRVPTTGIAAATTILSTLDRQYLARTSTRSAKAKSAGCRRRAPTRGSRDSARCLSRACLPNDVKCDVQTRVRQAGLRRLG
jgi:hypothetical protein